VSVTDEGGSPSGAEPTLADRDTDRGVDCVLFSASAALNLVDVRQAAAACACDCRARQSAGKK